VIGHLAGLLADPSASPRSAAALLDLLPAKSDKGAAYDLKKLSDQQLDQLNHLTSIATGEPPELTQPPELTDADYAFVKVLAELRPRCGPSYRPGRELPTIEAIGAVRDALDILLIRAGVELDDVAVVGPREGRHEKMLVQLEVGDLVLPAAERRFFDLPVAAARMHISAGCWRRHSAHRACRGGPRWRTHQRPRRGHGGAIGGRGTERRQRCGAP
jgi:hypothetical protein